MPVRGKLDVRVVKKSESACHSLYRIIDNNANSNNNSDNNNSDNNESDNNKAFIEQNNKKRLPNTNRRRSIA